MRLLRRLWTEEDVTFEGEHYRVGSPEDVAQSLAAYHRLGITRFILSDTPYREEAERVGSTLLPRLRELTGDVVTA
jgi:alkanesulfonate monooxygenase SsuD/methylene tetrahydromethanopterin reductase-like flavin-dependent oxidoreductase (luciferase family)